MSAHHIRYGVLTSRQLLPCCTAISTCHIRTIVVPRASRRGNLMYCGKYGRATLVVVLPSQHIQQCCTVPGLYLSHSMYCMNCSVSLFDFRWSDGLSHAHEAGLTRVFVLTLSIYIVPCWCESLINATYPILSYMNQRKYSKLLKSIKLIEDIDRLDQISLD